MALFEQGASEEGRSEAAGPGTDSAGGQRGGMTTEVLHGDCVEIMRTMSPCSIDLVVADPPYGETSLSWDIFCDDWLNSVRNLLKPSGSLWCFGSLRFFMKANFAGFRLAQEIIWEKHNGSNSFADRFRRVHEIVAQFYDVQTSWGTIYKSPVYRNDAVKKTIRRKQRPPQWGEIDGFIYCSHGGGPRLERSVLRVRSEHGRAVHPTQKPVDIITPLVMYSCPRGGLVLDPFCGSGAVGVVCKRLGVSYIGIELNPEYVEMAKTRIENDAPLFNTQS